MQLEEVIQLIEIQESRIDSLETLVKRLIRSVYGKQNEIPTDDLNTLNSQYESLSKNWLLSRKTKDGHFVEKINSSYYLYLSHLLRNLEIVEGKYVTKKYRVVGVTDVRKKLWNSRKPLRDEFSVEVIKLDSVKEYITLEEYDTMVKKQQFKSPNQDAHARSNLYLVKLKTDGMDEETILESPLIICKGKVVSVKGYLEVLKQEIFKQSFNKEIDITLPLEEVVTVPQYIPWKESLSCGKELFLDKFDKQQVILSLSNYTSHFKKLFETIYEKSVHGTLVTPFSDVQAYSKWSDTIPLVSSQIEYFQKRVQELVRTGGEDSIVMKHLLGNRSYHDLTLNACLSDLKKLFSFLAGLLYTNFRSEDLKEPDLFTVLLTPNLHLLIIVFATHSKDRQGRGNCNETVVKKIGSVLLLLNSLVRKTVITILKHEPFRKIVDRNIREIEKVRVDYYKRKKESRSTAEQSGTSPVMEVLRDCYERFRVHVFSKERPTKSDLSKLIFLGIASRCYGFRSSHYLGLQWGKNINTLGKYLRYELKPGDSKNPDQNCDLWIKTYLSKQIPTQQESLNVGINMMDKRLDYKKKHLDDVFLPVYHELSLLFHDIAAFYLKESEYIEMRRKNLADTEGAYKWMLMNGQSYVDQMATKFPQKSVLGLSNYEQLRTLFRDIMASYHHEIESISEEESLEKSSKYTIRGLRRMTTEHVANLNIHPNAKKVLCKALFIHKFKTHIKNYDKTDHYYCSTKLRLFVDKFMDKNDSDLIQQVNQEAQNPYFDSEDEFYEIKIKLIPVIKELLIETGSIWDIENTKSDTLYLFEFSLDNLETNIKEDQLIYCQVDHRPKNLQVDLFEEDDWGLFSALLTLMCCVKTEKPKVFKKYKDLIKSYVNEEEINEYLLSEEWLHRTKLMKRYKLLKKGTKEDSDSGSDSGSDLQPRKKTRKKLKKRTREDSKSDSNSDSNSDSQQRKRRFRTI